MKNIKKLQQVADGDQDKAIEIVTSPVRKIKDKGGRPPAFKNVDDLISKLEAYKEYLQEEDKPPTIAGLAYFVGVDRQTIYNYASKDMYFDTIKHFRDWILMNLEELAIDRSGGGIVFLLKNYGYTDKTELAVTAPYELDKEDPKELERLLRKHNMYEAEKHK